MGLIIFYWLVFGEFIKVNRRNYVNLKLLASMADYCICSYINYNRSWRVLAPRRKSANSIRPMHSKSKSSNTQNM